jgi:murein DD-endopeptidase MepM/ murein hydrolase activator NlpD
MVCVVQWLRSPLPRAAMLTLLVLGVAACSDGSTRFNDNPFSSKISPEVTGSVPPGAAVSSNRVESYPLPPQAAASTGVSGGGKGMASYTPSSTAAPAAGADAPEVTGAVTTPKPAPSGHWSWEGGTPVTVGPGDTIETIARRYGVPAPAIMKANKLTAPATIHPGQQLVVPRYQAAHAPASSPKPAPAAAMSAAGNAAVHVVAPGETLSRISHLYGKPLGELARANHIPVTARLNVGDRLVIPGVRTSAIKSKPADVAQAPSAPSPPSAEPTPSASVFAPIADAVPPSDTGKTTEETGSLPKFRWPANGRVINAFGPSTNGQQNDGINIAVPENTPVKAAEDGVVAYAGNELKGYGNLVLVRHSNGYVTAYAHAKELLVKRGDTVKRGQVIARSGQSGNVNAPQLHFEIRKGASPVDPTKFLSGA